MKFDPSVFWDAVTSGQFARGALLSFGLAVLSLAIALVIGFFLALMRTGPNPLLRSIAAGYTWFFRAIPTLVVLLIIWNALPQIFSQLQEGWFTPFIAAVIGLSVTEAAYMAEILRAGLLSVDEGQGLAARALGMSPRQVMYRVKLPQLTRVAIPPTGNEFISVVKLTSLASVISLTEILATAEAGIAQTFRYVEFYSAALVYYLAIVSVLMVLQSRLERRYRWTRTEGRATGRPKLRPIKEAAA